jgi:1-deoxy-D-xylulose-5-phosphate reductoisomerase
MKKLIITGCTGSIGLQTASVVRNLNNQGYDFRVTGLAFGSNLERAMPLINEFSPKIVAVASETAGEILKNELSGRDITVLCGKTAAEELCRIADYDICVNSIVGVAGLLPSHAVLEHGADIALANKETVVTDGDNFMKKAASLGRRVIPIDSEHSAIFQSLTAGNHKDISKLIVTASGGPFFGRTREQLSAVTPAQALAHPNWSMGQRITVDSSTLVNKGFEVIEAVRLFNVPVDKVEVVVHRESIIHSMVEFNDGAVIAQLGTPDMELPIQYALVYPERPYGLAGKLDFSTLRNLSFSLPDMDTFRGLPLSVEALRIGGNATAVLNAADEVAVEYFLSGKIGYLQIFEYIEEALSSIPHIASPSTDDIIRTDLDTREYLKAYYLNHN